MLKFVNSTDMSTLRCWQHLHLYWLRSASDSIFDHHVAFFHAFCFAFPCLALSKFQPCAHWSLPVLHFKRPGNIGLIEVVSNFTGKLWQISLATPEKSKCMQNARFSQEASWHSLPPSWPLLQPATAYISEKSHWANIRTGNILLLNPSCLQQCCWRGAPLILSAEEEHNHFSLVISGMDSPANRWGI